MQVERLEHPSQRRRILVGTLAIVALFLLSSAAPGSASAPARAAAPSDHRAASLDPGAAGLASAERSLSQGMGPAAGVPLECAAPSTLSARCAPATASSRAPGVLSAGAAVGNAQWLDLSSSQTSSPGAQQMSLMAYLPSLGGVVLIGGTGTSGTAHTWLFKAGQWSDITTNATGFPPTRWAGGLVYDAADGYLVMFGGRDSTNWFNDTWTFNGTTWTNLGITHAPAPRAYFTMVYDPLDGYVVAFSGGCWCGPAGARVVYNDTWTYSAGVWTDITAGLDASPPLLAFYPGAWDAHDGYLVVFGGNTYGS